MRQRTRRTVGASSRPCGICRSRTVDVVLSEAVRRGWARLRPGWDRTVRLYDLCLDCGARNLPAELQPA